MPGLTLVFQYLLLLELAISPTYRLRSAAAQCIILNMSVTSLHSNIITQYHLLIIAIRNRDRQLDDSGQVE